MRHVTQPDLLAVAERTGSVSCVCDAVWKVAALLEAGAATHDDPRIDVLCQIGSDLGDDECAMKLVERWSGVSATSAQRKGALAVEELLRDKFKQSLALCERVYARASSQERNRAAARASEMLETGDDTLPADAVAAFAWARRAADEETQYSILPLVRVWMAYNEGCAAAGVAPDPVAARAYLNKGVEHNIGPCV